MALDFNKISGSAKKGGTFLKWVPGSNQFRMVGGVLPRYMYWVKGADGSNHPFECLGFDRDQESFTNEEKDWVQEMVTVVVDGEKVPAQCAWSYTCLGIDRKDGKVKVIPLKKKMTEAIIASAGRLGDPTNPETGYDIIVDRKKTGSNAYNVEYNLDILGMAAETNKTPLTDAEKQAVADSPTITELTKRETPDAQLARLQKVLGIEAKEDTPNPSSNDDDDDLPGFDGGDFDS